MTIVLTEVTSNEHQMALMLDEKEKNAALSGKKKRVWGFTSSKIQTIWSQIVNAFWDLWNFPNCIDAIDEKHVKVQAPQRAVPSFSVTNTVFLLFFGIGRCSL
jgi:hypothetical protein